MIFQELLEEEHVIDHGSNAEWRQGANHHHHRPSMLKAVFLLTKLRMKSMSNRGELQDVNEDPDIAADLER